jgi:hypothetical protein
VSHSHSAWSYFQSLPKRPSKLPIHSTNTSKPGNSATKPAPLSVSNHNIRPGIDKKNIKDNKNPEKAATQMQPAMKRKLSPTVKEDTRVARVKLNNNTKSTVGIPKRPISSNHSTKTQSNGSTVADKQNRAVPNSTSVDNRRKPLAAVNAKKSVDAKDTADNMQQAQNNPATGMPKLKKRPAWDTKGRLSDMEQLLPMLQSKVKNSDETVSSMKGILEQEHSKSMNSIHIMISSFYTY